MNRTSLNLWIAGLLDQGAAAGTTRLRQLAVRRFTAWLIAEALLPEDPFHGVKAPKLDQPVVDPLTDDELRALIKACVGPGEHLHRRRDEAIVRLMFETGIRAGEVVALATDDLDLARGLVTVRRGKAGTGRVVPISPTASLALSRDLALRQAHPLADSPDLWLGDRGKRFGYDGMHRALRRRAQSAGIEGFALTGFATRPPTAGSPRAAPNPVSWPWPAGPHRHARALHQSPCLGTGRTGSPALEPWTAVDALPKPDKIVL